MERLIGKNIKPLNKKAYGHIPHLPGSRMGSADHHCHEGQSNICISKVRDKYDRIIVTEKLDGSCVAVAKINNIIYPLGRAGWLARTSQYKHHKLFDQWVWINQDRFLSVLQEGERIVGEWLALAHATRYILFHEPFVVFDFFDYKNKRLTFEKIKNRILPFDFIIPHILSDNGSYSIQNAMQDLQTYGFHGAIDMVEGAVWRVERKGDVDFLAKYVRSDKKDGVYLPEISGKEPLWNWYPGN